MEKGKRKKKKGLNLISGVYLKVWETFLKVLQKLQKSERRR